MPRYGDLDVLLQLYENTPECNIDGFSVPVEVVRQNIKDMPTADVVEVVRCKDCKWNSKLFKDVMFSRCLHPRSMTMIEQQDNHFCGYGERKTDE